MSAVDPSEHDLGDQGVVAVLEPRQCESSPAGLLLHGAADHRDEERGDQEADHCRVDTAQGRGGSGADQVAGAEGSGHDDRERLDALGGSSLPCRVRLVSSYGVLLVAAGTETWSGTYSMMSPG